MKPNRLKNTVPAFALFACVCAAGFAQSSSSYFLEGSYNRYRLNPALTPERAFASLPALGGTAVESNMNVGLANFIYESKSKPGSLTTFMSGDVNSRKFLDALPDMVRMNVNADVDLISFGFGTSKWYGWFDSRLRSMQSVAIPDDLFAFMKAGLSAGDYDICDLSVTSMNFVQTSLGFRIRPIRNLSAGASTNLLWGAAYSKVGIDRMHAAIGPDSWTVSTAASVTMAVPETRIVLDEDGKIKDVDCDLKHNHGVDSYGLTVDVGGEYDMKDVVPGLRISASITDIGAMLWRNVQVLESDRDKSVVFDGFADDGSGDRLDDDFEALARFSETGDDKVTTAFDATYRLGASYSLPGLDWLVFGELVTMRGGMNELYESRTSVNIAAGSVLDVSGSLAFSNLGTSFGSMLNLHPKRVNLFLGVEAGSLDLNSQFIPLDSFSFNVSLGVRMAFGKLVF